MTKRGQGRLAALLLAWALAMPPVLADDEAVVTEGEVSWVSGGVGADSRERLDALEAGFGFNLKLIFALQSGDYLSEVAVRLVDAGGRTVLQANGVGPILLVRLPAGSYDCIASVDGREQRQKLKVVAGRLGRSVFRWPAAD